MTGSPGWVLAGRGWGQAGGRRLVEELREGMSTYDTVTCGVTHVSSEHIKIRVLQDLSTCQMYTLGKVNKGRIQVAHPPFAHTLIGYSRAGNCG